MSKCKFRLLNAEEIDVRVGQVVNNQYKQGANLLLYKNARVDMDILDETVGSENWQRKHYAVKDNMYCSVGIKCGNDWVWKDDCGVESNTEAEKGEASDSFKRACVNWGIGRELYTSPAIFVNAEVEANNGRSKLKYNTKYYVKDIGYDENRRINRLVICSKKGNSEFVEYQLNGNKISHISPDSNKPKNIPQKEEKSVTTQNTQSNGMTVEQALNHTINFGVHKGKHFSQIPEDYLKWLTDKAQDKKDKEAATLVLQSIRKTHHDFLKECQDDDTKTPFD